MEYAYEKLMKEEKLTMEELPADAKIGIETIKKIERAVVMTEKKGHKVRPDVLNKVKANDKWVTREILDYIEGKDSKQGDIPHEEKEVVAEIQEGAESDEVKIDQNGVAIDKELEQLLKDGKSQLTADELKASAPRAYELIFNHYEENGENGVETSFYKIVETEKQKFTITKL